MACVHEGEGRGQSGTADNGSGSQPSRTNAVADSDDDRPLVHVLTDVVVPVQAPELHVLSDTESSAGGVGPRA